MITLTSESDVLERKKLPKIVHTIIRLQSYSPSKQEQEETASGNRMTVRDFLQRLGDITVHRNKHRSHGRSIPQANKPTIEGLHPVPSQGYALYGKHVRRGSFYSWTIHHSKVLSWWIHSCIATNQKCHFDNDHNC
jgi:hypothetical protein